MGPRIMTIRAMGLAVSVIATSLWTSLAAATAPASSVGACDTAAIAVKDPILVEGIGAELRLSAVKGALVVSQPATGDKPAAEWRFRVVGTELKSIAAP